MKKFLVLVMMLSTLVFAGCQSGKTVSDDARAALEADIKSVLENSRMLEFGEFDFTLNGQVQAITENSQVDNVVFDANLKTLFSSVNEVTRMRDLLVNLAVSYDNNRESDSIEAELILKDQTLYAKLATLPSQLEMLGAGAFVNQWIKFDIPRELLDSPIYDAILKDSNLTEETEEERRLRELYNQINFFKEIRDFGVVNVDGKDYQKYGIEFDSKAIVEYYRESAIVLDETIVEDDLFALEAFLDSMDLNLELYITEDKLLHRVEGDLKVDVVDEFQNLSINLNFKAVMNELEANPVINVPAGAIDFMNALMM